MFDANAAHIAVGEIFFAEVHYTNEQLQRLGVTDDALVFCQHIKKRGHNLRETVHTKIWLSRDSEALDYFDADDEENSFLVYSGRPCGGGFICRSRELQALELMGGKWSKNNLPNNVFPKY